MFAGHRVTSTFAKKWINSVENGNFFNRVRIHIAASSLDFNAQYQNDEMNTLYFYILLHAFGENIRFMCSKGIWFSIDIYILCLTAILLLYLRCKVKQDRPEMIPSRAAFKLNKINFQLINLMLYKIKCFCLIVFCTLYELSEVWLVNFSIFIDFL